MSIALLVKELRERTGAGMMDCKKALEASDSNIEKAIEWLRENGIAKAAKKGDRVAAEGLTKVEISGNRALILELNAETDFVAKNKEFLELLDKISKAIIISGVTTIDEALNIDVDGDTIENLIVTGTATIGEKISLRRISVLEKKDSEDFVNYSHMNGKISVLIKMDSQDQELGKGIAMHIAAENPEFLNANEVSEEKLNSEKEILLKEALNEGKPQNIAEKMVEGRIRKYIEEVCLLEQSYVLDSDKKVKDALGSNSISEFKRFEVGEGIEKIELNFAEEVAAQANI